MMKKKNLVPAAVAASVVGFAAVLPNAYAEAVADKTMEQRADQAQSAIKDAWLDGKLETALLFNEHLNSFAIDTEVTNNVAYLSGSVESDIDRDLAGEIAKSVDGISKVENKLTVDQAKARAARDTDMDDERHGFKASVLDATLTARVKSQLLINGNTQGMAIDVDSDEGVVTLSGDVNSQQEKELAGKIAANTEGTRSVNNNLTIEQSEDAE